MDAIVLVMALLMAALLPPLGLFLKRYRKLRGTRIVTCPETHRHVAVRANASRGAFDSLRGQKNIELAHCTRWPEKKDCGQECLREVKERDADCLVRNIVARWYEGKHCRYCGKPFVNVSPDDHPPGVLIRDICPVEWSTFKPQHLLEMFSICEPLCWDCLIAEGFRFKHPDLVTDREIIDA